MIPALDTLDKKLVCFLNLVSLVGDTGEREEAVKIIFQ